MPGRRIKSAQLGVHRLDLALKRRSGDAAGIGNRKPQDTVISRRAVERALFDQGLSVVEHDKFRLAKSHKNAALLSIIHSGLI